jgi:hypothetical protein
MIAPIRPGVKPHGVGPFLGKPALNRASRSLGLEKIMLLGENQPKQGDGEQQGQKHKRDDYQRQDSVQRHRAPCYPTRYLREEKF